MMTIEAWRDLLVIFRGFPDPEPSTNPTHK